MAPTAHPAPVPAETPARANPVVYALGIALLAILGAVYASSLGNAFVWDDWTNLIGQRAQRGWNSAGISWAFTNFTMGHYQPLTWLSFAAAEALGGGEPFDVHAVNLAIHGANTLLVWSLTTRILRLALPQESAQRYALWTGLLIAAAFALHPMRVESVAWATQRRDLLSAMFLLIAMIGYLRVHAAPLSSRWQRTLPLLACLLCYLSKAQVGLPLLLLALDLAPLKRVDTRAFAAMLRSVLRLAWEKWPYFLLSLLFGLVALNAQHAGAALVGGDYGWVQRLAQACYGLVFYLRATLFDYAWYPLHEVPLHVEPWAATFAVPIALVSIVLILLLANARRCPAAVAAALAYFALLVPVLGLAQSGAQLVADRYSYLAVVPWWLLAGAGVVPHWQRWSRPLRSVALGLALLWLVWWAAATRQQTTVWRDDVALWQHVLRGAESALAHHNLAQFAGQTGNSDAAIEHLRQALAVKPGYSRSWQSLQRILAESSLTLNPTKLKDLQLVLAQAATQIAPSATVETVLGLVAWRLNDPDSARRHWQTALVLRPGHPPAVDALARDQAPLDASANSGTLRRDSTAPVQ